MISFLKIFNIPGIAVLMSFFLGIAVAAIFRPMCKGPDCVVVRGPPIQEIRNVVYQFSNKCVEFKTKPVECPTEEAGKPVKVVDTVSFADYE
jgi:hypothetical protein